MKLSLSWIKDFVNIPEDMDMKQLAYDLTMDTVEVEDVEYLTLHVDLKSWLYKWEETGTHSYRNVSSEYFT